MLSAKTHKRKRESTRFSTQKQDIRSHAFRGDCLAEVAGFVVEKRGSEWICGARLMEGKDVVNITKHETEQAAEAEARRRMREEEGDEG